MEYKGKELWRVQQKGCPSRFSWPEAERTVPYASPYASRSLLKNRVMEKMATANATWMSILVCIAPRF